MGLDLIVIASSRPKNQLGNRQTILPQGSGGHLHVCPARPRISPARPDKDPDTIPNGEGMKKVIREWQAQLHHSEHFFPLQAGWLSFAKWNSCNTSVVTGDEISVCSTSTSLAVNWMLACCMFGRAVEHSPSDGSVLVIPWEPDSTLWISEFWTRTCSTKVDTTRAACSWLYTAFLVEFSRRIFEDLESEDVN